MQYRKEIDGLRAIAVIPVILFHAGFRAFSGGYVGVDVFFVISGYLITSLILAEKAAGTFTLVSFYERRARRILPALFLVMFAFLPSAWLWLFPADMVRFSESLAAVAMSTSNILFWRTSGYFEPAADLQPLLHTWSLGVEEQYYVLFPLFMVLAWRKRWMVPALILLTVVSLAMAQWGSINKPTAAFYLLPTRGWEILVGALAGFYLSARPAWRSELGGAIGLALIAYSVCAFDEKLPYPSLYTLVPVAGTALIILCAAQTRIGNALGSAPLVGLGLISYSAYLWHQPLFAFAKHRSLEPPGAPLLLGLAVASLVLAFFSWKYVEVPFRDRSRFTLRQITFGAVACVVLFIGLGAAGYFSGGYPQRFATVQTQIEKMQSTEGGTEKHCETPWKACLVGAGVPPSVAVLGDSHASTMQKAMGRAMAAQGKSVVFYTGSWCAPLAGVGTADAGKSPQCRDYMAKAFAEVAASRTIKAVVLVAEWGNYTHGSRWNVPGTSYYSDAASKELGPDENLRVFERGLARTLALLKGKQVILVKSVPEYEAVVPVYLEKNLHNNGAADLGDKRVDRTKYDARNKEVDGILKGAEASVVLIDPFQIFCQEGLCRYIDSNGNLYYIDDSHLSNAGAKLVVEEIFRRASPFSPLPTTPQK